MQIINGNMVAILPTENVDKFLNCFNKDSTFHFNSIDIITIEKDEKDGISTLKLFVSASVSFIRLLISFKTSHITLLQAIADFNIVYFRLYSDGDLYEELIEYEYNEKNNKVYYHKRNLWNNKKSSIPEDYQDTLKSLIENKQKLKDKLNKIRKTERKQK